MVLSDMPFFFTGRVATDTRVSKFVNSPVGASGLSGNTMKCLYSHLNKIFSCLYNQKIGVSDSVEIAYMNYVEWLKVPWLLHQKATK